jgi:multisubunit Na+/H+ antiporter MnhB subunit
MASLTLLPLAVDGVLALMLLWLAWRALSSPDLFRAVVLFIAFGLVLALVWVRLEAADIALAEIALGAGVTGALLLGALASLQRPAAGSSARREETGAPVAPTSLAHGRAHTAAEREQLEQDWSAHGQNDGDTPPTAPRVARIILALLLLGLLGGLGFTLLSLPEPTPGLAKQVGERLADSGVDHPVTAVLLNFRGYDTLLELAVLLLALIAVWSLASAPRISDRAPEPVLVELSRLLAPLMILVAAYLVWVGAQAPGGAFQAGSVLGAAGVLLRLSGMRLPPSATGWPLRLALVAGVAVFASIGLAALAFGEPLLGYPNGWAKPLILTIELTATLSIGAILAALFIGGRP